MTRRRMAFALIAIVLALIAALVVRHAFQAPRVWIVGMVPLADTERFSSQLAREIARTFPGRLDIQFKNAGGEMAALTETLEDADNGRADLLVAVGVDAATSAHKTVRRVPVVYCKVSYAAALGLETPREKTATFVGVSEDVPVETYCRALAGLNRKWGDAAVILPKGYVPGEAEAEAFSRAYESAFSNKVRVMAIDAQTCAQLLDVVAAYNLVTSQAVDLYYAVNDGNIAKYMSMIIGQCTRRGIPVIGGGEPVLSLGGMLTVTPDNDAEARLCAGLVAGVLKGEPCSSLKTGPYVTLWNTNALERLGLAGKPAN